MKAASTKIIVRKGKLNETTQSGVALPTNLKPHVNVGLVLDIGPKVTIFGPGGGEGDWPEVVLFNAYQQSGDWDDLETKERIVIIDEVAVLAIFAKAEAEKLFNVTFEEPAPTP